jgi:hypothetical protein
MAKKKETWGFDTPGMQTQQWLDGAERLIEGKEINWTNELNRASRLKTQADGFVEEEMAKPEGQRYGLAHAAGLSRDWYIALLVIRLGLDVVALSKQVTACQKMIEDMKLAIKC